MYASFSRSATVPKLIPEIGMTYPKQKKSRQRKEITPQSLVSRIPIAGLGNYLDSQSRFEHRMWTIVLIVSSVITMYYLIPCFREYLKFTKVVEVAHISENALAFPPLQIAVANGLNKTYLFNEFTKLAPILEKDPRMRTLAGRLGTDISGLITQSIVYMTHPPDTDDGFLENWHVMVFNELIYRGRLAFGDDWKNTTKLYTEARLHCGEVVKKCTYQDHEFPCCPGHNYRGHGSMTTTLYKINIPASVHSSTLGSSRMVIQTAINVSHLLPHLLEEAGIWVHFGHHLGTAFDAMIPISPGSNALIRVKRKKRHLLVDCTQTYQYRSSRHQRSHPLIQRYFQDMEKPDNYHINKCMTAVLMEELYYGCGCVADYDTMSPNDTTICTPAHTYVCIFRAFQGQVELPDVQKKIRDLFEHLKRQISECQALCDTWEYQIQITSLQLSWDRGDIENVISNQITIDTEVGYELVSDTLKIDALAFEAGIGDALGLFLGMSAVSFVQTFFWGIAAICLMYKRRRIVPVRVIE